ncbi:MAG TPA: ABC transporter ATP-binding protein [Limnochordales bacterium]
MKWYGDVRAVDGISFTVAWGEVFGLLGPNGAGKTTTLEILEGLRRPSGGFVAVAGADVTRDRARVLRHTGLQLQATALFELLTVRETIDLFGSFYGQAIPTDRLLADLALEEKAGALVQHLSGGQKQRLSLALALVHDPDIVFLDEPTAGLDPQARRKVWDVIRRLRDRGKTVILSTHYMEEAQELCDRVAILDHGRILALGTPAALVRSHFEDSIVEFTVPGAATESALAALDILPPGSRSEQRVRITTREVTATLDAILRWARDHGLAIDQLTVRNPSLEDVFIELTGRSLVP